MKILLIEDDRELAESMKFQLEKEATWRISARTVRKHFIIWVCRHTMW